MKDYKKRYKQYCDDIENVENFDKALADDFVGWEVHHRLETHNSDGERRIVDISHKELIALDMYYHRPANELIFLTTKEHSSYKKGKPNPMTGKHHTEESRKKMSENGKGKNKGKHLSEETKKKIGAANKGRHHTEETKRKISKSWDYNKHFTEESRKNMSKAQSGENNGMFGKHHSEDTRHKIAEKIKGTHWFNNGKISIRTKECPDGFVPGRLK